MSSDPTTSSLPIILDNENNNEYNTTTISGVCFLRNVARSNTPSSTYSHTHHFHLVVTPDPDNRYYLCSVCRCKLIIHKFLETKICRDGNHVFRIVTNDPEAIVASCTVCPDYFITFTWDQRVLKYDVMKHFLLGRYQSEQLEAFRLFLRIVVAASSGTDTPVNTQAETFKKVLGEYTGPCETIFKSMGFTLRDDMRILPPKSNLPALQRAKEELLFEVFLLQQALNDESITPDNSITFEDGKASLLSIVGGAYRKRFRLGSDFGDFILREEGADYKTLGCVCDMHDDLIIEAYDRCITEDSKNSPKYLQALQTIATDRDSQDLLLHVATERSKGIVPERELAEAYKTLGIDDVLMPDDMVLTFFQSKTTQDPYGIDKYRSSLRAIQEARKSEALDAYLISGEFAGATNLGSGNMAMEYEMTAPKVPAGLNNIGNTCYLNSLLQYYFSIRPLRDSVLEFNLLDEITVPQGEQGSVDSKKLEHMERSRKFVVYLQKLFAKCIWSNMSSITPAKELADLALTTTGGQNLTFGAQQDMSECMDNIMDLLETAFKHVGTVTDQAQQQQHLHQLFYGKMRQTLKYKDANDTEKTSCKDEEFNHLIVEVEKDLYTALDNYFEINTVDFEGAQAIRELILTSLPKVLTIQINRVKFNRETSSAFKSNDFLRFPKFIHMSRYLESNVEASRSHRLRASELRKQLKSLEEQIQQASGEGVAMAGQKTIDVLQATQKILEKEEPSVDRFETLQTLDMVIATLHSKSDACLAEMDTVEKELANIYADMDQSDEYRVHAVFVHQGDAAFGHYWAYMYDLEEKRWLKYNDSIVSEVSEDEVFADTTGSSSNAYALIYVRNEEPAELVGTFARSETCRVMYEDKYPFSKEMAQGEKNGSSSNSAKAPEKTNDEDVVLVKPEVIEDEPVNEISVKPSEVDAMSIDVN